MLVSISYSVLVSQRDSAYKCNVHNQQELELGRCGIRALPIVCNKCCIVSISIYTYIAMYGVMLVTSECDINARFVPTVTS